MFLGTDTKQLRTLASLTIEDADTDFILHCHAMNCTLHTINWWTTTYNTHSSNITPSIKYDVSFISNNSLVAGKFYG